MQMHLFRHGRVRPRGGLVVLHPDGDQPAPVHFDSVELVVAMCDFAAEERCSEVREDGRVRAIQRRQAQSRRRHCSEPTLHPMSLALAEPRPDLAACREGCSLIDITSVTGSTPPMVLRIAVHTFRYSTSTAAREASSPNSTQTMAHRSGSLSSRQSFVTVPLTSNYRPPNRSSSRRSQCDSDFGDEADVS